MHSHVGFEIGYAGGMFKGSFAPFEASLDVDTDGAASLKGQAQADSVHVLDENLNAHLLSPDFFDAERTPLLGFESTEIRRAGDEVAIAGELTIKGAPSRSSSPARSASRSRPHGRRAPGAARSRRTVDRRRVRDRLDRWSSRMASRRSRYDVKLVRRSLPVKRGNTMRSSESAAACAATRTTRSCSARLRSCSARRCASSRSGTG